MNEICRQSQTRKGRSLPRPNATGPSSAAPRARNHNLEGGIPTWHFGLPRHHRHHQIFRRKRRRSFSYKAERISSSTVLLLAYTAKNLRYLHIRRNAVILKCDWPKSPVIEHFTQSTCYHLITSGLVLWVLFLAEKELQKLLWSWERSLPDSRIQMVVFVKT